MFVKWSYIKWNTTISLSQLTTMRWTSVATLVGRYIESAHNMEVLLKYVTLKVEVCRPCWTSWFVRDIELCRRTNIGEIWNAWVWHQRNKFNAVVSKLIVGYVGGTNLDCEMLKESWVGALKVDSYFNNRCKWNYNAFAPAWQFTSVVIQLPSVFNQNN